MKKNGNHLYILLVGLCSFIGCTHADEELVSDNQAGEDPIEIFANIEGNVRTRAYGDTGYEDTKFAAADQIGVFATRTRKDSDPVTLNDIFHGFANVGYSRHATAAINAWNPIMGTVTVKAPLFPSTMLDIYAYYPHAALTQLNAKTNIIINTNDLHNVTFRIHQNQTQTNMKLCNIMRAIPILNQSYTSSKRVTLTFQHILSYLEFQIYLDSTSPVEEERWEAGDIVYLDRVVALGNKISTEGSFDLVDPAGPNVKITTNATTSNGSIYKADATGTPIVDGVTGATEGGLRYLRRHMIVPPVDIVGDSENVDPSKGEQGDMEVMLELRYMPAGGGETVSANRHYFVAAGTKLESGKKYVIKVPIKKAALTPQKLIVIEENILGWTNNSQTYSFD